MSHHSPYLRQARQEIWDFHWNAMKRGPYYRDGELRIPAYVYDPEVSPRANEEWKRRKLRWNPDAKEWRIVIPARHAESQVRKARRLFDRFWNIEREQDWKSEDEATT